MVTARSPVLRTVHVPCDRQISIFSIVRVFLVVYYSAGIRLMDSSGGRQQDSVVYIRIPYDTRTNSKTNVG